jgi:hypothetical protein
VSGKPLIGQQTVHYGTGQGMGAYTSWALMAVIHHLLLRLSANRLNISPTNKYLILGDDIVVFHKGLFSEYLQVLNDLNIPHKPSSSVGYCEFAKRHFWNGREVSGLSLKRFQDLRFGSFWAQISNLRLQGFDVAPLVARAYDWTRSVSLSKAAALISSFPVKDKDDIWENNVGKWLSLRNEGQSACNFYGRENVLCFAFKQFLVLSMQREFNSYAKSMLKQLQQTVKFIEDESSLSTVRGSDTKVITGVTASSKDSRDALHKTSNQWSSALKAQYKSWYQAVFNGLARSVRQMEKEYKLIYHDPTMSISSLLRPDIPESLYDSFLDIGIKRKDNQRLNFRVTQLVRTVKTYDSIVRSQ